MSTPRVVISFRKSEAVEIENESDFVAWAQSQNRDDLLTYKDPVPNKTAIKKAIKDGQNVSGAELLGKANIQIK